MRSGKSRATSRFEAAQQQRAQFGREAAAGDALFVAGVFAARFVFFAEFLLRAQGSPAG